jgi:3-oxoacyl-[acyl-carrier protein] reductase
MVPAVDLGLKGTTAIVCGASAGMGLAISQMLAAEGCAVTMFSRSPEKLEAAAARVPGALAVAGDVRDDGAQEQAIARTLEQHGRLDILINNAGGPPPGTFAQAPEDAWLDAFELSLHSAIRFTRRALPHLKSSGRGRVVNITSWSVREPIPHLILSNTMRPGIVGWAKTVSHEFGPDGITVNTIAPGKIATGRMHEIWNAQPDPAEAERRDRESVPAKRLGEPEEIAAAVAFLCSDRAAYISGVVLPVDGGVLRGIW